LLLYLNHSILIGLEENLICKGNNILIFADTNASGRKYITKGYIHVRITFRKPVRFANGRAGG